MDRFKEEEFYCKDCDANFIIGYEPALETVLFCAFCGSSDVSHEEHEKKHDSDEEHED